MSLRTRLIIAFLILSVVPLSAVTLIWYVSAVQTFERVAEQEASQTAADLGRRMEMITANLGRRVDRLFDEAAAGGQPDATGVRERLAPMLGESAALFDRLEFHPTDPDPQPNPNPDPEAVPPPPPDPGRIPGPGRVPGTAPVPPVPPAPPVIVIDVPQVVESARRAARVGSARAAELGKIAGVDVGAIVQEALKDMPAAEAAVKDAIAREAIAAVATRPEMAIAGRRIEVPVKKGGKIVGKANATLNMDLTLRSVLALARREQGEIPFAIDQQNRLYTPDPDGRGQLERIGVTTVATGAAAGSPKRLGDWLVVARKDPGGIIFGIARPIGGSLREIRRLAFRNLSIGLAVIALAGIGIIPISHRMTQHVSSLTAGVKQLAGGDFKVRVPVHSKDEFGTLASSFNRMAEDLERNQALVVEQERLRRELELSRLIQTEMLPHAPLRLGTAEIKGLSIPAREVGGDFFNYFALPDGRLALLVGDVSGKGVSAALLMANIQATLRARLPLETDLARLADGLDREVDENTPHSVYITLFLGILDMERSVLRYVNAGHNPQFLLHQRGGIDALSSTGMPIALFAGQGYQEAVVPIQAGDLLFFYTDGLVETESESGEMFGADRLQSLLSVEHEQHTDTVLERVDAAVREFRGRAEPFDDATMMALRIDS